MTETSSSGVEPATTRRFAGRWRRDGSLTVADDFGSAPPTSRLGCVVFLRGHVADKPDLSRRLGLPADAAADEEALIAHAYRRWGRALPVHVLGEYAACIVDAQAGTLLLVHDALGLGPLLYCEDGADVVFATHLVDLIDLVGARPLDDDYLADYLARGRISNARTPYAGILRLLPGTSFEATMLGTALSPVWRCTDVAPLECATPEAYEERFLSLLQDAVRASVHDTGPSWFSLSGGLDSSTLVSVAAHLGLPGIGAYSYVSPGSAGGDESAYARSVIEQYPMPWEQIDIAAHRPFTESPQELEFMSEPTVQSLHGQTYRWLDDLLVRHGVRSLLTGHGGDVLLGAGPSPIPTHLVDLVIAGQWQRAGRAVDAWSREHPERRSRAHLVLRAIVEPAIGHWRGRKFEPSRTLPLPGWFDVGFAKRRGLFERSRRQLAPRDRFPGRQDIADSVWTLALTSGGRDAPADYDVRRPFLYRPFLEFMLAVPGTERMQPRCDRYLQRRALKGVLPEIVRRRGRKHYGTWSYVDGLARAPEWIDFLSGRPRLVELGIADAERWRDAVLRASLGDTQGDRYFFTAVAIEAWLAGLSRWQQRPRSLKTLRPDAAGGFAPVATSASSRSALPRAPAPAPGCRPGFASSSDPCRRSA